MERNENYMILEFVNSYDLIRVVITIIKYFLLLER